MTNDTRRDATSFHQALLSYLKKSGFHQRELAQAIYMHPKVLSRKLNGTGNAHLDYEEIRDIIKALAHWGVISVKDEVFRLLEMADVPPRAIFSAKDWQEPPLSTLATHTSLSSSSRNSRLATSTHLHNFPAQTTSLIGRTFALVRLRQWLGKDMVRLITLVGPGGSGKTRLAIQAASGVADSFEQGAWFVDLSGVSDAATTPLMIMQALGIQALPDVSPVQSLIAYMQNKDLLLVLDNFEQVAQACDIVAQLLVAAPRVKILVTSRVALRLYGEHQFKVQPLALPDLQESPGIQELAQIEAVQLFVERAQAVRHDFTLTNENAEDVAHICMMLDGLPLALELAAARIKVLTPETLKEQLVAARLSLLTDKQGNRPSRQKTLHQAIAWSYDLLSPEDQAWFRRLGIFAGGWSFEAAEALMHAFPFEQEIAPEDTLPVDRLERLADNCLISLTEQQQKGQKQTRYKMLETLREYALALLEKQQAYEQLRDWHACFYLREAEAAEAGLRGPRQLEWLARLKADHKNIQAALEWSLDKAREGKRITTFSIFAGKLWGENATVAGSKTLSTKGANRTDIAAIEVCLRLAPALRMYWEWQGELPEGRQWLNAVLALPLADGAEETTIAARAKALSEAARLVCLENDQNRSIALAEESIAIFRRLDDPIGLASALLHRGWPAHVSRDYEQAIAFYDEGLQGLSATDDPWLRAQLLFYIGDAAGFLYDFGKMHSHLAQCKAIFEQIGDTCAVADVLKDWGALLMLESDYSGAISRLLESLKLCQKLDHKQFITTGMCWLSLAFGLRGEPDPALASTCSAQLEGATETLAETIGLNPWARTDPLVQVARQVIRERLDEQSWQAAWETGRKMTIKQALDLAQRLGEGSLSQAQA